MRSLSSLITWLGGLLVSSSSCWSSTDASIEGAMISSEVQLPLEIPVFDERPRFQSSGDKGMTDWYLPLETVIDGMLP